MASWNCNERSSLTVLEESRAALDDKTASRAFVPAGVESCPAGKLAVKPRPGCVFFLVRDRNALRSQVARDISKLNK